MPGVYTLRRSEILSPQDKELSADEFKEQLAVGYKYDIPDVAERNPIQAAMVALQRAVSNVQMEHNAPKARLEEIDATEAKILRQLEWLDRILYRRQQP